MVIVGLAGTIDSKERLEPVIDVEQLFDDRFIDRKKHEAELVPDSNSESSTRFRASGSAVTAFANISPYLSPDDISNIRIGHESSTSQMLKRLGD